LGGGKRLGPVTMCDSVEKTNQHAIEVIHLGKDNYEKQNK
jgi:hypothetical protein